LASPTVSWRLAELWITAAGMLCHFFPNGTFRFCARLSAVSKYRIAALRNQADMINAND
jgi:hypothetical protein